MHNPKLANMQMVLLPTVPLQQVHFVHCPLQKKHHTSLVKSHLYLCFLFSMNSYNLVLMLVQHSFQNVSKINFGGVLKAEMLQKCSVF